MKKIIAILAFLISHITNAQILETITETRTLTNNNNDLLHQVANVFSARVGNALKKHYPATLENMVDVKIESIGNAIRLTYSANIVPSDSENAYYYFDHRGALSCNLKKDIANKDAEERCNRQFNDAHRNFLRMSSHNVRRQWPHVFGTIYQNGMYWTLCESFLYAPKNN